VSTRAEGVRRLIIPCDSNHWFARPLATFFLATSDACVSASGLVGWSQRKVFGLACLLVWSFSPITQKLLFQKAAGRIRIHDVVLCWATRPH